MAGLFITRAILYAVLMFSPLLHPGVLLYGDVLFFIQTLVVIPVAAVLAWFSRRMRTVVLAERPLPQSHLYGLLLPLIFIPYTGFNTSLLTLVLSAQYAYWSTYLAFHRGRAKIMYLEPFYFALVLYRLLSLSRLSEDAAMAARGINALLFGFLFLGFLAYSILIYRIEYISKSKRPRGMEVILSAGGFLAIALIVALVLPNDFVRNLRVLNNLDDILEPTLRPLNDGRDGDGQNGNTPGEAGGEQEGQVMLMSPDNWGDGEGRGEGEGGSTANQYMVMVVDTPVQPLYLADQYFNDMDQVDGFVSDPDFAFNRLTRTQFLETWKNPEISVQRNRTPHWADIFSTIPDKVSSYEPYQLEPTVYDNRFYPLTYSYRSQSLVSQISLSGRFPRVGELNSRETEELASYLEVNLDENLEQQYREYLAEFIDEGDSFSERVIKILESYANCQYELGYTDNVSVEAISAFLFETQTGDCTEFSNSAAILGRLANIPSRVVTGYLVSDGLQNPSHREAMTELQRRYPPLADRELSRLYLVTTAHRHSWTQYYFPVYGWVDIEATANAIPPPGGLNPNDMNVVIPDIYERSNPGRRTVIPWGIIARILALAALVSLTALYLFRWLRIVVLRAASRKNTERGYKALYRLLLIRLLSRGYPAKGLDSTPTEYASLQENPELVRFAGLYTTLVFNRSMSEPAKSEKSAALRSSYKRILRSTRTIRAYFLDVFSLRDLRYL